MTAREQDFERMLVAVQDNYRAIIARMERLKAEGKIKSATFRQLMGDKLTYQTMLSMYRAYGLLGEEGENDIK